MEPFPDKVKCEACKQSFRRDERFWKCLECDASLHTAEECLNLSNHICPRFGCGSFNFTLSKPLLEFNPGDLDADVKPLLNLKSPYKNDTTNLPAIRGDALPVKQFKVYLSLFEDFQRSLKRAKRFERMLIERRFFEKHRLSYKLVEVLEKSSDVLQGYDNEIEKEINSFALKKYPLQITVNWKDYKILCLFFIISNLGLIIVSNSYFFWVNLLFGFVISHGIIIGLRNTSDANQKKRDSFLAKLKNNPLLAEGLVEPRIVSLCRDRAEIEKQFCHEWDDIRKMNKGEKV